MNRTESWKEIQQKWTKIAKAWAAIANAFAILKAKKKLERADSDEEFLLI